MSGGVIDKWQRAVSKGVHMKTEIIGGEMSLRQKIDEI